MGYVKTFEAETPLVLLADVHLGANPSVDARFAAWIARVPDGWTVVSLGDLVDAWIEGAGFDLGDRFPVLTEFRRFRSFFLHGNRDFLAGPRWEALTGGRVLGDLGDVVVGGRRFRCLHGDTLLTKDWRYQVWRRVCRNPIFRFGAELAGRRFAERMASRLRAGSAAEVARKARAVLELDRAAADRVRGDADLLVCGHTHSPLREALPSGRELVVLGAWEAGGEIVVVDAEGMRFGRPEDLVR